MIRGRCNAEGKWPVMFAAVPREGELVQGMVDNKEVKRKVKSITHSLTTSHDQVMNRTYEVPFIIVDFH